VLANRVNLALIAACWGLALVLPHFQTNPQVLELIVDSSVVFLLFFLFKQLLNSGLNTSRNLKSGLVLISFGGLVAGVSALALDGSSIYDFWSHLGSGTMKSNGEIFLFGDLVHLTSAASCSEPIIIGNNVCDPWGRLFNQNPQLGELFRFLHITNIHLIGFLFVAIFILSIVFAVRFLKVDTIGIYILVCTPVVVLAVDRGNELLTITLIMAGLYAIRISNLAPQSVGALAFGAAVFFKLWPIFLVLLLLLFQPRRIKTIPKIILILATLYWLTRINEIREIMKATQSGSPYGVSFGLKLFTNSQLSLTQLLFLVTLTFVSLYFLIKVGNRPLTEFMSQEHGSTLLPWVAPIMLTYSAIWATGDSYIYRMVILIPLVLILSQREIAEFEWSKFVTIAILITAVTSRLAVTTSISSALALYFIYVTFYGWRNRVRPIQQLV
jgi:hypothetical protein